MKERKGIRQILLSLVIIGLLASTVTASAVALWTDTESSSANVFTTGTLDIALTDGTPLPFNVTGMAPGDNVTGTLVVTNSGSLQLRYAMTTTGDGASILDEQLDCVIMEGVTTLYSGKLSSAVIGNPAQGAQAGDRTLNSGNNETLTFTVSLPIDTDNTYQGLNCSVDFVFAAEQTDNNP